MLKYILVSLLFVATTAEATDRNGQFSVGGNLGFVMEAPWASDGFKDRTKPGLPKTTVLGRYHHDNSYTGWEVSLDYFALGGNDLNSTSALISFFWRFMPNKKLHPILSAGTGYSKNENFFSEGDFSKNMFRLRAGVEYEMTPKMDLTFHLDHYFASHNKFSDISLAVLAPSVGVLFYFGTPTPPVAAPAAAPGAVADGDSDGDGVKDSADRCKGTEKGQPVNELGCAVKQAFELKLDLKFATGSTKLDGDADAPLAELASILKANEDVNVEIQGHTDSKGSAATNRRLSQARADYVRQQLMSKHGIDGSRLTAKGYGASQPVDSNNTDLGRRNNRRVIAVVARTN